MMLLHGVAYNHIEFPMKNQKIYKQKQERQHDEAPVKI